MRLQINHLLEIGIQFERAESAHPANQNIQATSHHFVPAQPQHSSAFLLKSRMQKDD